MNTLLMATPEMRELIAQLPVGCRECDVALFGIASALHLDTGTVDPLINDIQLNCDGWQDQVTPMESLLAEQGTTEFRKARILAKYCPYDLNQAADFEDQQP